MTEHGRCPDGGTCHSVGSECESGCYRVATSGPLSGVYPDARWPDEVRDANGVAPKAWAPTIREGDDPIRSAVLQAIGAASMCWEEIPKSVFDSTKATWIGNGLLAWLDEHREG